MGNAESKKHEAMESNTDSVRVAQRSLPELVSVPIDSQYFENSNTPTSSSDEPEECFVNKEKNEKNRLTFQFNLIRQLYRKFYTEVSSSRFELISGFVDVRFYDKIANIAQSIGFKSCEFDAPICRFQKECSHTSTSHTSIPNEQDFISHLTSQMDLVELKELDLAVEEGLTWYLAVKVKTKKIPTPPVQEQDDNNAVFSENLESFLLPEQVMEKIFEKVAKDLKLIVQRLDNGKLALCQLPDPAATDGGLLSDKSEKPIQLGELVWRRLQHWSTNVRKEKKFNIWTKGLPEFVKSKILEIALEIGFESAVVQSNGNIHLEIKPPEGLHRRKLKHATDAQRQELIPIDKAVCENAEMYLSDWISEFDKRGDLKQTLNCRFVLPAEWLRQTSARLADEHGLCVKMETGIELVFYKSNLDLSQLEQESKNKTMNPSKKRSKTRSKKPRAETGVMITPSSSVRDLDLNKNQIQVENLEVISGPLHYLNLNIDERPALKRDLRGGLPLDYNLYPNWPLAQFYNNKELDRFSPQWNLNFSS
eukprot:g7395.t1